MTPEEKQQRLKELKAEKEAITKKLKIEELMAEQQKMLSITEKPSYEQATEAERQLTAAEQQKNTENLSGQVGEFLGSDLSLKERGLLMAARSLTTSPKVQDDILRKAQASAQSRGVNLQIQYSAPGQPVLSVVGEDGNPKEVGFLNKPGASLADVKKGLADTLFFSLGGLASAPVKTGVMKTFLGGLGAGSADYLEESTARLIGDSSEKIDPIQLLISTAAGGLGEAVTPMVKSARPLNRDLDERSGLSRLLFGRNNPRQNITNTYGEGVARETSQGVEDIQYLRDRGVINRGPVDSQLLPDDMTQFQAVRDFGRAEVKATADKMLRSQNAEVAEGVENILNEVIDQGRLAAASRGKNTIRDTILTSHRAERRRLTSPDYRRALGSSRTPGNPPKAFPQNSHQNLLDDLNNIDVTSSAQNVKNAIIRDITNDLAQPNSAWRLHRKQMNYWNKGKGNGEIADLYKAARAVVSENLKNAIPEYAKASAKYRRLSIPYARLEGTAPTGATAGSQTLDTLTNQSILSASKKIYNENATPEVIRQARSKISRHDPELWDAIQRTKIEDVFNRLKFDRNDANTNVPEIVLNAFTPKLRANIEAGMSAEQRQLFNRYMGILKFYARREGPASLKGEAISNIKSGIPRPAGVHGRVISAITGKGQFFTTRSLVNTLKAIQNNKNNSALRKMIKEQPSLFGKTSVAANERLLRAFFVSGLKQGQDDAEGVDVEDEE